MDQLLLPPCCTRPSQGEEGSAATSRTRRKGLEIIYIVAGYDYAERVRCGERLLWKRVESRRGFQVAGMSVRGRFVKEVKSRVYEMGMVWEADERSRKEKGSKS